MFNTSSPRTHKTIKLVIENVFPSHIALGADAKLQTAHTLPHDASDGVQSTGTTHLTNVDHTWTQYTTVKVGEGPH